MFRSSTGVTRELYSRAAGQRGASLPQCRISSTLCNSLLSASPWFVLTLPCYTQPEARSHPQRHAGLTSCFIVGVTVLLLPRRCRISPVVGPQLPSGLESEPIDLAQALGDADRRNVDPPGRWRRRTRALWSRHSHEGPGKGASAGRSARVERRDGPESCVGSDAPGGPASRTARLAS